MSTWLRKSSNSGEELEKKAAARNNLCDEDRASERGAMSVRRSDLKLALQCGEGFATVHVL